METMMKAFTDMKNYGVVKSSYPAKKKSKARKTKNTKKKKKHEGSGPNEPTVTSGCKTETVSYTIVKGDGYEKIANKFKRCHGLTAESLKQQNDGKELKAGEKIVFECKCEEDIQN